jgi:arginase
MLALMLTAAQVQERGPKRVAGEILEIVDRRSLAGFWIHLDVDVLDPSVMPAVDSPAAGGLSTDELGSLVSLLAPRAIGAQVTVFDPDLDPGGALAHLITDLLAEAMPELGGETPRGKRHG